jgi:hypothetical protein
MSLSMASTRAPRSSDKVYEAGHLCEAIAETGAEIVIPPKRNRKVKRACDADLSSASSTSSSSNSYWSQRPRITGLF